MTHVRPPSTPPMTTTGARDASTSRTPATCMFFFKVIIYIYLLIFIYYPTTTNGAETPNGSLNAGGRASQASATSPPTPPRHAQWQMGPETRLGSLVFFYIVIILLYYYIYIYNYCSIIIIIIYAVLNLVTLNKLCIYTSVINNLINEILKFPEFRNLTRNSWNSRNSGS